MSKGSQRQGRKPLSVLYTIVVPLYNVHVTSVERKAFQFTWKPKLPSLNGIVLQNVSITLFDWNEKDDFSRMALREACPIDSLPEHFDSFHALPGRPGSPMLVIRADQLYPPSPHQERWAQASNSYYADQITEAFVGALKLYDDTEPHVHKGYYFRNGMPTGCVMHWPIKEMQGPPMRLNAGALTGIRELFFDLSALNSASPQAVGHRVNRLARRYYVLSSTQTEYDITFLFLMIAFEAMFKKSEEKSVSQARRRFGKLLSDKKCDYSKYSAFMSEDPNTKGCCFLRNALVHGDESADSIGSLLFWELKGYLRMAIVRLINAIKGAEIDPVYYYDSLDKYVEGRFRGLPAE